MARHLRLFSLALALVFLVAHLQALPRSLEDIDTINLALGVEAFDVVNHQPHPPGYPVFVAMGRVSTAIVSLTMPGLDRTARAAIGLAIWGVLAGTTFVWVLVAFWRALGWSPAAAWYASALVIVSPLFWFTSVRPLTDAVALVAAMAVQVVLVRHTVAPGGWSASAARGLLILASFAAGVLIGLRTQTLWLTAPLLVLVVLGDLRRRDLRHAALMVGAAAVGSLVWAVPLIWSTGGLDVYLTALTDQGREDFAGVEMLATDRQRLDEALPATFIRPWRVSWLGQVMTGLALIGLVRLVWQRPAVAVSLAAAFVPYLVFHLAFQETETVRYALPLVVPVAGLAMSTLFLLPTRVAGTVAGLLAVASVITAQPALSAYGASVPPTFQAYRDAGLAARTTGDTPLVVPHGGLSRVADWHRPEWPSLPLVSPRDPSWLRIVDHFRAGETRPAWFLTDRRLLDVGLFDPRTRTLEREYLQDSDVRRLVGQARQDEVRWWRIERPGWMLGRGWALSPDVAGETFATGRDPALVPADGYLRRGTSAHRLMVGGRYLAGQQAAVIVVEIDGRVVSRWDVTPQQSRFLYWVDLPPGLLAGEGPYATMHVSVAALDEDGALPRVGLEQFDFAPSDDVMMGFADGWHEPEVEVETGRAWRWAEPRATLLAYAGGETVRLTLTGEAPRRYFERPSTFVVSVEGREVGRFEASADFVETMVLPAGLFTTSPSRIVIETDQVFVPAEREDTGDRRRLAQRFFAVDLRR